MIWKKKEFFKRPLAKNLCLCFMSKVQKTLVYYVLSFLLASWPVHHLIPFQDSKPGRVVELGLQNMEWTSNRESVLPFPADKTNCASFNSWPLSSVTIKQLEATRKEFLHHCTPKKNLIYFENMHSCQLNQLTPWQEAASTKKRPWYWTVSINGLTKWLKRSHLRG